MEMKNKILIALTVILLSAIKMTAIDNELFKMTESFKKWEGNKYSMLVHFGLYSHLGGIWNGEPVDKAGELIQSGAGIYYDIYEQIADAFDPQDFDAEVIVQTAKDAGMRSVIFTAKHHDGFCMFDTQTTEFNSVDMTQSGRDYVREMALACKSADMGFGLYFSLIDWHSPYGAHISSHNADKVSENLHNQNKEQVYELMLNYGDISEIWFDMGSLTPEQSQEIYDVVKRFQPTCMVSDHLGNGRFDFAITGEGENHHLHEPWQTLAPMFEGTLGWRSWEEKGSVAEKYGEKLTNLVETVSFGGNYVLNVGLDKDGNIGSFERTVLERMGGWLKKNGEAIYEASPSPFDEEFDWGCITTKDKIMYIILSGEYPSDGEILIPSVDNNKMLSCKGVNLGRSKAGNIIKVKREWFSDNNDIKILEATYKYKIQSQNRMTAQRKGIILDRHNASIEHSHSGYDHYTGFRSETSYTWAINRSQIRELQIFYTKESLGKEIGITADGRETKITLDRVVSAELNYLDVDARGVILSDLEYCRINDKMFDTPLVELMKREDVKMSPCAPETLQNIKVRPMQSVLMKCTLNASTAGYKIIEVEAGNGIEVVLNGEKVMKHMNPYGTSDRKESVMLKLKKGRNEVIIRSYNRFEGRMNCAVKIDPAQFLYRKTLSLGKGKGTGRIILKNNAADTHHHDAGLHNFIIITR